MTLLFKSLNEFNNYIPTCVLCGKIMTVTVEGRLAPVLPSKPRWSSGQETVTLKLLLKDGVMRSKHKNHSLVIDGETNSIIDGQDLVNRFYPNSTYIRKTCATCHFKIVATYPKDYAKKATVFPYIILQQEELRYTLKGGKDVQIYKNYHTAIEGRDKVADIRIDNKYLPPVPWDFSKFDDLDHLNNRIKTIILFH